MNMEKQMTKGQKIVQSPSFKLFILGILILILLIPVSWTKKLIRERAIRRKKAISEISSKWGLSQTVVGPILSIPYNKIEKQYNSDTKKYDSKTIRKNLNILPEVLNYSGNMIPEERYRGIYTVIVYQTNINSSGYFTIPDLKKFEIEEKDVLWDKATLSIKISDFRSLQEDINLVFDEKNYSFYNGNSASLQNSVITDIQIDPKKNNYKFDINLNFNGSDKLTFIPLGKTTNVELKSIWADPSFIGNFLPDDREVTDEGFSANWKILQLNRSIEQVQITPNFKIVSFLDESTSEITYPTKSEFGVRLLLPVNHYTKSDRSVKYCILFILFTFITFFVLSISSKVDIHPIQYILIGLAVIIFYTLLLSLSEHIGFNSAYWLSSISIILLLTIYSKAIFKNKNLGILSGGITLILYGFIFMIIQMQDFALLVGSIGLFIALCILMYVSLKLKLND